MSKSAVSKNVALALFGSIFGIGLGLIGGYLVIGSGLIGNHVPEGAQFDSPEDFRRAMLERDSRDTKSTFSVSLRSILEPHDSDVILYTLRPNLDVRFQGQRLITNSYGIRGPETTIAKPENVYRIALLGDSFAFGWGVAEAETFGRRMEAELNKRLTDGRRVEVLNFGVPGYSTFQEVAHFEEVGLKFSPDAVLVFFVDNDFGLPFFFKNFNDPTILENAQRFEVLRKHADTDEAVARRTALSNSLNPNHALWRLADKTVELNIPAFVALNPRNSVGQDIQNLWALQQRKELQHVQIRDEFRRRVAERGLKGSELILPKDMHPSGTWHEMMGTLLADRLYPTVVQGSKAHKDQSR